MVGETISHYRILAQIGAGGMGVVYKAYDEQLEREVALKVLLPGLLAEEGARKRFRKEALALARLNHPNIATIFEFGNEGGADFLVTEYIPGITLDMKLSAGALGVEETVRLGTQLATGLAAAHEQGLIHRDLKPGNLRVTPDGLLKILDFGLAQLVPRASDDGLTATQTRTQEIAGTLPYMAPEQLRGGMADARTDIWAVGAVLHEMVTGKRPFSESGTPLLINAILNSNPPRPSKTNQNIPSGMDDIILKALQKDVARRYQTASELRADLERLTAGAPVLAQAKPQPVWIFAGVVLLVVVLGFAGYFVARKRASERGGNAARSRRSVAVLGFKNLGSDKNQNWLSTALSEMLTTELAAGDRLRTVPGENVARVKADLALPDAESLAAETLAKVHSILGTNLVVLGSYLDLDGQIRVDVRVQDAAAGETVAKFSQVGTEAQLFDLVRHLGETLRNECGAGEVTPEQATSIRASQPVNTEAAKLYAQGLAKLRSFDSMQARELLTQAVAKDPAYVMAHEALAEVWSQLGYDDKAKDESRRAFELSAGLSRQDALGSEARFREETREWTKAVDIYHSLWTVFPDDPEYGLRLASAQVSAGRGQDALLTIDWLRKIAAPMKDDPRIDLAESRAAGSLSDYKRAEAATERAILTAGRQGSEGLRAEALLRQCWALRNLGDPGRAMAAGQQAGEILGRVGDLRGQARSLTCVADVLADQGQLSSAQGMHERALELARKIGAQKDIAGALINLGNVQAYQQKLSDSTRQYQLALALANSIGDKSAALLAQDNLGANLSLQGDFTAARKSFEESVRTAEEIGDQAGIVEALINLSFVSYLQGDLRNAKEDLDKAIAKARQLQLKSRLAMAVASMGDVLFAEDDLRGAEQSYQQSLTMRGELGEKGGVANSHVSLAIVALENGQLAQAETLARDAAKEFETEKDADQRTAAEDVLAQSLIAQGNYDHAAKEIDLARKLGARDLPTTLSLTITRAKLLAKTAKSAEAVTELQQVESHAGEKGLLGLEWQARLALADAQIASGNLASARANLQLVKRQAAARGFGLLARKAAEAEASLRNRSPQRTVSESQPKADLLAREPLAG
jgi:serine/threonine protein kinase/tetratricopeptide (TPR) repeat protein